MTALVAVGVGAAVGVMAILTYIYHLDRRGKS